MLLFKKGCKFVIAGFQKNHESSWTINFKASNFFHKFHKVNKESTKKHTISKEISEKLIELERNNNYKPAKMKEILNIKYGKDLDYTKVKNVIYKAKKVIFGNPEQDIENLIETLSKVINDKIAKPFLKIKVAFDSNQTKSVILITEKMRELYSEFQDVILIDSTFGTNKYKMSLILPIGINNEGKNIIFGIGLLCDDSMHSYKWFFEQFFSFMGDITNKNPVYISSDEDLAIKGIFDILPNLSETIHGICAWHKSNNFKKHFASLLKFGGKEICQDKSSKYGFFS